MERVPWYLYVFQALYGCGLFVDLIVRFALSPQPMAFLCSVYTVIDCLCVPSLILSRQHRWLNFNFLQAYVVRHQWDLLEKNDVVLVNQSTIYRLFVNIGCDIVTYLYLWSCGVQLFELHGIRDGETTKFSLESLSDAVYIAIVTMTTVGYGDFSPHTFLGRFWVVLHIMYATYLVSSELSRVVDVLKNNKNYTVAHSFPTDSRHVVVTGTITWEFLVQFVREFLGERSNIDTYIVVLATDTEWSEEAWNRFKTQSSFYDYHLRYVKGSPLHLTDLNRAQLLRAEAVFVLSDPHKADPYSSDSNTLKVLLRIRHLIDSIPIYTMNSMVDSSFPFRIAMQPDELDLADMKRSQLQQSQAYGTQLNMRGYLVDGWGPESDPEEASDTRTRSLLNIAPLREKRRKRSLAPDSPLFPARRDALVRHSSSRVARTNREEGTATQRKRRRQARSSESICMQQLEMSLLAENAFCNGVSTLITNLCLRVSNQPKEGDMPWMLEYKLGSMRNIRFFKVPEFFGGLRYSDISLVLFDYGLVILGTKEKRELHWKVASTDMRFHAGSICAAISNDTNVEHILEVARLDLHRARNSQRHKARHANHSKDEEEHKRQEEAEKTPGRGAESSSADGTSRAREYSSSREISSSESQRNDPPSTVPGNATEESGQADTGRGEHGAREEDSDSYTIENAAPKSAQGSPSSRPRGLLDAIAPEDDTEPLGLASVLPQGGTSAPAMGIAGPAFERSSTRAQYGDETMEVASETRSHQGSDSVTRSGAVAESASTSPKIYDSETAPPALRQHIVICIEGDFPLAVLGYLLRKLATSRTGHAKAMAIVVIHPSYPRHFEKSLGDIMNNLFLVAGSLSSEATLHQASVERAKAILIISSGSTEGQRLSTDSKAVFTIMGLDTVLQDSSTAFVCCLLDSEKSLQFLRSSRYARRRGSNLGERQDSMLLHTQTESVSVGAFVQRRNSLSISNTPVLAERIFSSFLGEPTLSSRSFQGSARFQTNRTNSMPMNAPLYQRLSRSRSSRFDAIDDEPEEYEHGTVEGLHAEHEMSRFFGEEFEERSRFAAGETMISSLLSSILVREYQDPGFLSLLLQLIGANIEGQRSWVRQLDIPESWADGSADINGRSYRDTFEHLISMGCIPLGLYRSGVASVRIETGLFDSPRVPADADPVQTGPEASDPARDVDSLRFGLRETEFDTDPVRMSSSEFDELTYICPTTKQRTHYVEAEHGFNTLPYVYTSPDPFTQVAAEDAVFVICHPDHDIPRDWNMLAKKNEAQNF